MRVKAGEGAVLVLHIFAEIRAADAPAARPACKGRGGHTAHPCAVFILQPEVGLRATDKADLVCVICDELISREAVAASAGQRAVLQKHVVRARDVVKSPVVGALALARHKVREGLIHIVMLQW